MQVRSSNLYYLLSYAWQRLIEKEYVDASAEYSRTAAELFARVLIRVANKLLDQRLDRSYREFVDDLRRPRGKISLSSSIARGTEVRGVLECHFDELTEDVIHNQIIKVTVRRLSSIDGMPKELRDALSLIVRRMASVSDVNISTQEIHRTRLNSNLRRYRPALSICAMLNTALIPNHQTGRWSFNSFDGDEQEMGRLFEDFVCGFLSLEQQTFPRVGSTKVNWCFDGNDNRLLPGLRTDITLRRPGHIAVIETKCYENPLVPRVWGGPPALRSQDVCQLAAYLSNYRVHEECITGVLLYAVDKPTIPATRIHLLGVEVAILEVDLSQPWRAIDGTLRELVHLLESAGGATQRS